MLKDGPVSPATQQRHEENKSRLQDSLRKVGDFEMLAQGLEVTRRALDEFGGGRGKGLAISFNGGKDACVVLYLLLFVLAERDELWRLSSSAVRDEPAETPTATFPREEEEEEGEDMSPASPRASGGASSVRNRFSPMPCS